MENLLETKGENQVPEGNNQETNYDGKKIRNAFAKIAQQEESDTNENKLPSDEEFEETYGDFFLKNTPIIIDLAKSDYLQGQNYYLQGNYEQALRFFKKVIVIDEILLKNGEIKTLQLAFQGKIETLIEQEKIADAEGVIDEAKKSYTRGGIEESVISEEINELREIIENEKEKGT